MLTIYKESFFLIDSLLLEAYRKRLYIVVWYMCLSNPKCSDCNESVRNIFQICELLLDKTSKSFEFYPEKGLIAGFISNWVNFGRNNNFFHGSYGKLKRIFHCISENCPHVRFEKMGGFFKFSCEYWGLKHCFKE